MANYAVINGNYVSNIITADNKEETEQALGVVLIEYTAENPAGIGWTWDGISFSPPIVDPVIQS